MRIWLLVGVLLLSLTLVSMHLAVTAALYHSLADIEVQMAPPEEVAEMLVELFESPEFAEKLRRLGDEIMREAVPELEKLGHELGEAFGRGLSATQPAVGEPSEPNRPGQATPARSTSQPARDIDAVLEQILRLLRERALDANSSSKLEWHPVDEETVRELREKIESNEPNESVVLREGTWTMSKPFQASIELIEWPWPVRVKRVYRWPIWLTVYLVAGCALIALATAAVSIVILKRLPR